MVTDTFKAAIVMAIILVSTSLGIRQFCYEIFIKSHSILAAIVIAATWIHTPSLGPFATPTLYLLVASSLFVFVYTLWVTHMCYRNVKIGRPFSQAVVKYMTDVLQVHIKVSRPWKFRAGQYVYLCMPWVAYMAFTQAHPFMISWWYCDADGNDVIVLLIQPRRGFTRDLRLHATGEPGRSTAMTAFIEGPYGKELHLESYGTVLLFATGAGIAGQLPYVKQLMDGYHNYEVKTRRIALFWEMSSERK